MKYYPGKQPAEVFSRETVDGITHIQLGSKIKLNAAEQEKLQVNTLRNMSVVSAYATGEVETEKENGSFVELVAVSGIFLYLRSCVFNKFKKI